MQPKPQDIGRVNWIGLWTLYSKEVHRFVKVAGQTVFAPIITTLLFLAIFNLALGDMRGPVGGVPFEVFLAPGLAMMAVTQNAFANSSSALLIAKIQGNIVDLLMPPLSPAEMVSAMAAAAVTRGFAVAVSVIVAMSFFVELPIHSIGWSVLFVLLASLMMGLIGLLTGLWADKFDHLAFITNFVITPLAFLSGTFYSIERLPEFAQAIAHVNPFFYAIDGFRHALVGQGDAPLGLGAAVLFAIDAVLAVWAYALVRRGYNLKA
ncbi:MAG: multidrug ABC transporter permease [Rhizobiales bacterium NRL2]|nr:MAG: multidrug ABC transporter permease [Rhizobiales bacterium NRL2]